MLDRLREERVAAESWLQQRAEYRAENRRRLRERENLPFHDGERYVIGEDRVGLAVGSQKRPDFESAARDTGFDHVLSDPAGLASELRDLVRDAQIMGIAEGVHYVGVEPTMTIPDEVLASDDELDQWLQSNLMARREM